MSFCTAVNCMDGRTQIPVNTFCREHFGADFVDTITEAGPVKLLAELPDPQTAESILCRAGISVEKHGSRGIALVAHADCAGNPAAKDTQLDQRYRGCEFLRRRFPRVEVIGLWLGEDWQVQEVRP